MSEKIDEDFTTRILGSNVLAACVRCGSSATYRGSPEAINKAAKEFYELHERCWQRNKEREK